MKTILYSLLVLLFLSCSSKDDDTLLTEIPIHTDLKIKP